MNLPGASIHRCINVSFVRAREQQVADIAHLTHTWSNALHFTLITALSLSRPGKNLNARQLVSLGLARLHRTAP